MREKDVRQCISDVRESMGVSIISRRINQANWKRKSHVQEGTVDHVHLWLRSGGRPPLFSRWRCLSFLGHNKRASCLLKRDWF